MIRTTETCLVCGKNHGLNMPCPTMSPSSVTPQEAREALDSLVESAVNSVDLEYPDHPALRRKRNAAFAEINRCKEIIRRILEERAGVE